MRGRIASIFAAALLTAFLATPFCSRRPTDPELERRRELLRDAGTRSFERPPASSARARPSLDLIAAAAGGDLARLKELLRTLPPERIDARTAGGETALTHAVWFGHAACVAGLLAAGADPNALTDGGETALHYAIQQDHPRIVALLLDAGADARVAERRGYTPLMMAAGLGRRAVTERLLELGARPGRRDYRGGRSALLHAIRGGHPAAAVALMRPGSIDRKDDRGRSPLHYAVLKNDEASLRALLRAGADPNLRNRFGETPLMTAAYYGRAGFVRSLLRSGADPLIRDVHGVYDAALIARTFGQMEIARLLESPWRCWLVRLGFGSIWGTDRTASLDTGLPFFERPPGEHSTFSRLQQIFFFSRL